MQITTSNHGVQRNDVIKIIAGTGKGKRFRVSAVRSGSDFLVVPLRWYERFWVKVTLALLSALIGLVLALYFLMTPSIYWVNK